MPYDGLWWRMATAPFGNQFSRAETARGAGLSVELLDAWERRYSSLTRGTIRGPKRSVTCRSIIQVLIYASARVLTEHGIPPRHAVPWCSAALPAHFEAILRGGRKSAVAEVRRPSDGTTVTLDLVAIVADVAVRLELGSVTDHAAAKEEAVLAEVERVQRYMLTEEFQDRLRAFRSDVAARLRPATCEEAARALGIEVWLVKLALVHARGENARRELSVVQSLTTQLAGIVQQESDAAAMK